MSLDSYLTPHTKKISKTIHRFDVITPRRKYNRKSSCLWLVNILDKTLKSTKHKYKRNLTKEFHSKEKP